jgi:hypothetical protein
MDDAILVDNIGLNYTTVCRLVRFYLCLISRMKMLANQPITANKYIVQEGGKLSREKSIKSNQSKSMKSSTLKPVWRMIALSVPRSSSL